MKVPKIYAATDLGGQTEAYREQETGRAGFADEAAGNILGLPSSGIARGTLQIAVQDSSFPSRRSGERGQLGSHSRLDRSGWKAEEGWRRGPREACSNSLADTSLDDLAAD